MGAGFCKTYCCDRSELRCQSSDGMRNSRGRDSTKNDLPPDAGPGPKMQAMFIRINSGRVSDHYNVENSQLGSGGFSSVRKGIHRTGGEARAIKVIAKRRTKRHALLAEIDIMKALDHPNIIKLYESFEDHSMVYLVMELCIGGELFDSIKKAQSFSERQAANVMLQIVRGVNYMHQNFVCHRDLKPENFLLQDKSPIDGCTIKIIDFGLSCRFTQGKNMTTRLGSAFYISPEVLGGCYDHSCDLWSCGVIMYVLLCGYPPFWGATDMEVMKKVRIGKVVFHTDDWKNVSVDAKDLVRKLLERSTSARYTAIRTLEHTWIKHQAPRMISPSLPATLQNNLERFRGQKDLKKMALHVIARQANDNEIRQLKEIFTAMDVDQDGVLSMAELKAGLKKSGIKGMEDLKSMMDGIDANGNGQVDYTEFLAATMDKRQYEKESICWAAFRAFDRDGDGAISRDELSLVLASSELKNFMDEDIIVKIMKEADVNSDDQIDFEEFMALMRSKAQD